MFFRVAGKLVVRSWWRPCCPAPGERVLVLRAGGAFPPGHATTRLCLEMLVEAVSQRPVRTLLDLGCGSGVLALAALAMGVPEVAAVDVSRRAARVTWANALQAGLSDGLAVAQGSTECLKGGFDLIVANLPASIQAERVADCHRLAGAGGILILSGFKDIQEEALLEAYAGLGWHRTQRHTREDYTLDLPPDLSYTWSAWRLEEDKGITP